MAIPTNNATDRPTDRQPNNHLATILFIWLKKSFELSLRRLWLWQFVAIGYCHRKLSDCRQHHQLRCCCCHYTVPQWNASIVSKQLIDQKQYQLHFKSISQLNDSVPGKRERRKKRKRNATTTACFSMRKVFATKLDKSFHSIHIDRWLVIWRELSMLLLLEIWWYIPHGQHHCLQNSSSANKLC